MTRLDIGNLPETHISLAKSRAVTVTLHLIDELFNRLFVYRA